MPDEGQPPQDQSGAQPPDETQPVGPDLTKRPPSGPPEPPAPQPPSPSPYESTSPWSQPPPQQPYPQQPYPQQPYGQQPYGAPAGPYAAAPRSSGKATAVLVLGIASVVLLFMCGLGLITAIVALVMAPGAKREINSSQGRLTGLGMVQGGVVCSWITLALGVLVVALLSLVMVVGGSVGEFSTSTI